MFKKRSNLLLGIVTIALLSIMGCRVAGAYTVVENYFTLSYTNVNHSVNYETWSNTVQIWVYSGPSLSVTKTVQNLVTGESGTNSNPVSCVPGDTLQTELTAHNTGDTYAYVVTLIDTFQTGVGDPAGNSLSYVVGSETCAINGSLPADSISWSTDTGHTWSAWQAYSDAVSSSIPNTCTGIRWRWNVIVNDDENADESWIRVRYKWERNNN